MKNMKERLYDNLPTLTIKELYGYINEIHGGYIRANYHPEDNNIAILNYTEKTTFEKRWNKYTMSARGLILDLTKATNNGLVYILAKPFDKFPNFNSGEIEGYEDDINFDEIESIMEKMDGSLGISYFFNDEIRFATKGSFTSEQAIKATEIWRKNHAKYERPYLYVLAPVTYLVEIIYPENRIVVDYGGAEELVLLGVTYIFISDMPEGNYSDMEQEAKDLKMKIAPLHNHALTELFEMKKTISANEEGWIIKFKNGKRLKIKGDEYLQVHRIRHGMSAKAKYKAWAEGNLPEYIQSLPEEFRPELEQFEKFADTIFKSTYTVLEFLLEQALEETNDQKSFAIHVNTVVHKEYRKYLFSARNSGELPAQKIKDDIAKDYKFYEGEELHEGF